ncbi:MAG: hypothetical protein ACI9DC_004869 [Gammaproteobacteria bacterium]|jgi:hypothetical protein
MPGNQSGQKNAKIGDDQFSTPARALSTYCCPQATSVQEPVLLKNVCTSSTRQVRASLGSCNPRAPHHKQHKHRKQRQRSHCLNRDPRQQIGRSPKKRQRSEQQQFETAISWLNHSSWHNRFLVSRIGQSSSTEQPICFGNRRNVGDRKQRHKSVPTSALATAIFPLLRGVRRVGGANRCTDDRSLWKLAGKPIICGGSSISRCSISSARALHAALS